MNAKKVLFYKTLNSYNSHSIPNHNVNTLINGTVRDIYSNIEKPFLKAIKYDYPEFDRWFNKTLDQNRKCYFYEKDSDIAALLIYNIEAPKDHQLDHISDKALKLCTFKVSNEVKGYKLGESFIRESFKIAVKNNLDYIYLTVFPKHESLISLLTKHGFVNHSKNKKGELVYIRHLMSLPTTYNINLFTSSNGCFNIY
ncbi:GNAT family N-acetyltransferase [Pontibacter indicus]|uniref:GNAT family N-acetyltransferase n=1 Tax=Pontibacter indicus TaxID=1317125 RepID=UPI001115A1D7|nr:GNAT family N-acetyltransferase [Pontibacter indicus]